MYKLFAAVLLTIFIGSCDKDNDGQESMLYGTWIESRGASDPLRFYKKGNKNMLAYNASFNASLPAPTEAEYTYRNGKLSVQMYGGSFDIESFTWTQPASEFEIRAIELFPILSSTVTRFTYKKIQ